MDPLSKTKELLEIYKDLAHDHKETTKGNFGDCIRGFGRGRVLVEKQDGKIFPRLIVQFQTF